ncbi:MAG: hypothetical protein H7Y17_07455 [Chlorobia bacterium]|nr:hypothetical protein [Fimbriimonadaceae bacterium]
MKGEKITSPFLGKKIPYSKFTVPACRTCNTRHLQILESKIHKAFTKTQIENHDATIEELAVWTAKLLYTTLLHDYIHAAPGEKKEALGEVLRTDDYQFMHAAIQTLLGKLQIGPPGEFPVSLRLYRVKIHPDPKDRFGLATNTIGGAIALRMDHIGLLVSFDAGYASMLGNYFFDLYIDERLHLAQFEELATHWLYMSELQVGTIPFKRGTDAAGKIHICYQFDSLDFRLREIGQLPAFAEPNHDDFRTLLMATTRLMISQLGDGDQSPSWLEDPETARFREMDIEGPRY